MIKHWIEAMRLRTLPVSLAGVVFGWGLSAYFGVCHLLPAVLCLVFAILAQIASNFANEYFDYRAGLDRPGREGFRRGVTEGDISPRAMLLATLATLGVACCVGLGLMFYSAQWWLIIPGILIAIFALAYSTGPWPLSHHGLGDIAVIIFFGIVPVCLTTYVCTGGWNGWHTILPSSAGIGLMAANVLIVNNYRDADDDRSVNKHTTVVIFGRNFMSWAYLLSGIIAIVLMWNVWRITVLYGGIIIPFLYLAIHRAIWIQLRRRTGHELNPLLGLTALNLLLLSSLSSVALLLTATL